MRRVQLSNQTQEPQLLLAALADVQQKLKEFEDSITDREGVMNTSLFRFSPRSMQVTHPQTGSSGSQYGDDFGLSVSLSNGIVIDWWLEAWSIHSGWSLTAKVYQHNPDEDGSHILHEILDLQTVSFDEFLAALHHSTDQLISAPIPCMVSSDAT